MGGQAEMVGTSSAATGRIVTSRLRVHLLWKWAGGFAAFGLPFVVYLRTLAPTVYGLDSAHLTNAAYALGFAHPPGYPLYLLIGHLFTWLPVGDVGYRMNLMSAFFGALAIALHYFLLLKFTRRPLVALAAALSLAYSFFFWSPSVMAEVYTLHIFLMAALMLIVLSWQEQQHSKWLYLFALVYGLSLTNHLAAVLLAPGLLYWLIRPNFRQVFRPRRLLIMLALFSLGLSLYLYLPLRYVAHPPATGAALIKLSSWQDVLEVISAHMFWRWLFDYDGYEILEQIVSYLYALSGNFLGIGLSIGILGSVVTFQRRRNLFTGLALLYLANVIFFISYRVPDKWLMFAPTYFIWAIWMGLGYAWLLDQLNSLVESKDAVKTWQRVGQGLFLIFALIILSINFKYADLSSDRRTYEQANRIFETVEPGAYVLAISWFEVGPLEYLHIVEHRRPDVEVLNVREMLRSELYSFIEAEDEIDTRPFYSTTNPDWLSARYTLAYVKNCDCYRLER